MQGCCIQKNTKEKFSFDNLSAFFVFCAAVAATSARSVDNWSLALALLFHGMHTLIHTYIFIYVMQPSRSPFTI